MTPPNFDRIARPYRWLEYLTLGHALERCRLSFLPQLLRCRRALILGDGDGRFLAHLLQRNLGLYAVAVDISPVMLHLLRRRSTQANAARLETHQADALTYHPAGSFDLIVTHFFLDCLTDSELDRLAQSLAPHLTPGALWCISDFRIPSGILRLPASLLVRTLYLAFRLLTGLRSRRLPDHIAALRRANFHPVAVQRSLGGVLTAELWQYQHPTPQYLEPGDPMTTPSPVPDIPVPPGTDLPSGPTSDPPAYDPLPSPEPPSPSVPEGDPGSLEPAYTV